LPEDVIVRAKEILKQLEENDLSKNRNRKYRAHEAGSQIMQQLDFFNTSSSEIIKELRDLDVNVITPIEAIAILHRLAQKARE
jgi:DNA mismatch repair protein MutS